MAYEVIARKYRPQQFAEVVGQEHVTRTLANAIVAGRVAHAYLFVGPRGIGKTSIARIFAKALNCAGGPRVEPCDHCDSCQEIIAGRSMDVLEIDGASNNGVEQVRDLRDNARYLPTRGPYKIFIIDEVHMLSIAAFNALLKTLEEPPPHVKFILATTEPQKVPATIASRCQRFDLRRIATRDITRHLADIAKKEGVAISEDALLAIARGAEGGLRDAESALDQLIAFCSGPIEEDDVLAIFGLVSRRILDELCGAVLAGDMARILGAVDELDRNGKDLSRLLMELIDWFRNLLVMQCGAEAEKTLDATETQREALRPFVGRVERDRLLRIMETLIEADVQIRHALSRRVLLETTLFQCARAATTVTLAELLRELNRLKAGLAEGKVAASPTSSNIRPDAMVGNGDGEPAPTAKTALAAEAVAPRPPLTPATPTPFDQVWRAASERAITAVPTIRPHLARARLVAVSDHEAHVVFDAGAKEALHVCEAPLCRKAIQNGIRHALGRSVQVRLDLGETAATAPSEKKGPAESPAPERPRSGNREDDMRRRILEDPAVRNALEMFDGTITEIRP